MQYEKELYPKIYLDNNDSFYFYYLVKSEKKLAQLFFRQVVLTPYTLAY